MAMRRTSAAQRGKRTGAGANGPRAGRLRDRLASKRSARLLGALAEPERLRIIQCLEYGPPRSVGEICKTLGSALANVSHHLQHLRRAGLVRRRRRGRNILYSLTPGLFRPPRGDDPAVLDLGPCRLELRGDKAPAPETIDDPPAKPGGHARRRAAAQSRSLATPRVEGTWTGQWEPSAAANASVARGGGRPEIVCVVEARGGGTWHATFEGESGHPYKYSVAMKGRQVGSAILFKGSIDLGQQNGGVFDFLGRATEQQFVGYYSSARYTGVFSLRRADAR